jgi:chromate transporter
LMTPAFLIIILIRFVGRHADTHLVKSIISAVLLAGAALLIATTLELARSAVVDPFSAGVATASFLIMIFSSVDTVWIMLAAALAGLLRRLPEIW